MPRKFTIEDKTKELVEKSEEKARRPMYRQPMYSANHLNLGFHVHILGFVGQTNTWIKSRLDFDWPRARDFRCLHTDLLVCVTALVYRQCGKRVITVTLFHGNVCFTFEFSKSMNSFVSMKFIY